MSRDLEGSSIVRLCGEYRYISMGLQLHTDGEGCVFVPSSLWALTVNIGECL